MNGPGENHSQGKKSRANDGTDLVVGLAFVFTTVSELDLLFSAAFMMETECSSRLRSIHRLCIVTIFNSKGA